MALKAILKSLEGLSDEVKKLYVTKDGEFVLDVEGMVPKARHDEFRDSNLTLKKENETLTEKLKAFGDIEPAKVKELLATEQKLKENKLIEAGKFDELFNSKFDPIQKKHLEEREADKREKERLSSQVEKLLIHERLTKIATAKGLRGDAITDMLNRVSGDFKVVGDKVVALDQQGATRLTETGQPYTMEHSIELLAKQAPFLFQSSSGGGANGNNGNGGAANRKTREEFNKLDDTAKMSFSKEVLAGKATMTD